MGKISGVVAGGFVGGEESGLIGVLEVSGAERLASGKGRLGGVGST